MKYYIFCFLIAITANSIHAQSDTSDLIIGKWLNADENEIVEISFSNNLYFGNIVWLKYPNDKNGNPKMDNNNPNKKLRNQAVLGSQNIFGLQYKNGEWQQGSIYSYKRGGTINFKVISVSQTQLILKISKGLFSKEISYTRTKK